MNNEVSKRGSYCPQREKSEEERYLHCCQTTTLSIGNGYGVHYCFCC